MIVCASTIAVLNIPNNVVPFTQESKTIETKPFTNINNFTELFSPLTFNGDAQKKIFLPSGNYSISYKSNHEFSIIIWDIYNASRYYLKQTGDDVGGFSPYRISKSMEYWFNVTGSGCFIISEMRLSKLFQLSNNSPKIEHEIHLNWTYNSNILGIGYAPLKPSECKMSFHSENKLVLVIIDDSFHILASAGPSLDGHLSLSDASICSYSPIIFKTETPQNITFTIEYAKGKEQAKLPSFPIDTITFSVFLVGVIIITAIITVNLALYPKTKNTQKKK
jgi:hypothetical protein